MPEATVPHARLLTSDQMSDDVVRVVPVLGTIVTVHVVGRGPESADAREAAVDRALTWFTRVEERCSRFDESSELRQLLPRVGEAVPVSPILFEAIRFALIVAEETGGAFDPTVGARMEARGFNRDYRTGEAVAPTPGAGQPVSYRDVDVDPDEQTVTIGRPLVIDLGAVAKGLAIDMAAHELAPFKDFAIDAGGDLYVAGANPAGQPWSVGVRHPRDDDRPLDVLDVSDVAICTSGDYERRAANAANGHHIMDPRTGHSAEAAISATVIARTAMLADALATAAFVLGPVEGIRFLERHGADGLIVSPSLERFTTQGYRA